MTDYLAQAHVLAGRIAEATARYAAAVEDISATIRTGTTTRGSVDAVIEMDRLFGVWGEVLDRYEAELPTMAEVEPYGEQGVEGLFAFIAAKRAEVTRGRSEARRKLAQLQPGLN